MFKFLVRMYLCHFLGYIPGSGIVGSYGISFTIWRYDQTGFQSSCAIYTSTQCMKFLTSLLTFIIYLCDYIHSSTCEVVSHIMVLICISLMVNDVEHLSFAYWPFAHLLRTVYSDSLLIFKLGYLCFYS